MRHRKVKNLDQRVEKTRHYIVENPKENKGKWREFFKGEQASAADVADGLLDRKPLHIEIGCGKGKFLCARAQADKDAVFLGIEGLDAVLIRGLERADEEQIANVRFIMEYIADIRDYFADGEVDGIYLNFSDPWPKPRHEKRRFTYGKTLLKYKQILKPEGFVAFKTDNEELFEYSLGEVERLQQEGELKMVEMSRDLHSSDYDAKEFTTEYEEKFHGKGKNINYLMVRF